MSKQHPIFRELAPWLQPDKHDAPWTVRDLEEKATVLKDLVTHLSAAVEIGVPELGEVLQRVKMRREEADDAVFRAEEAGLAYWARETVEDELVELHDPA